MRMMFFSDIQATDKEISKFPRAITFYLPLGNMKPFITSTGWIVYKLISHAFQMPNCCKAKRANVMTKHYKVCQPNKK